MSHAVRRATSADLDEVVAMCAEYCAADGHTFDHGTVRAAFEPLLAGDEHGVVLVGLVDGAADGYAVATWGWSIEAGGFEAVLDELYVRTRGQGLGGRLIEAITTECRSRGARRIFLETEQPNERARRLYARHGFATERSIWMTKALQ